MAKFANTFVGSVVILHPVNALTMLHIARHIKTNVQPSYESLDCMIGSDSNSSHVQFVEFVQVVERTNSNGGDRVVVKTPGTNSRALHRLEDKQISFQMCSTYNLISHQLTKTVVAPDQRTC